MSVLINMNPYQGLKQSVPVDARLTSSGSNQHESLSGIETR